MNSSRITVVTILAVKMIIGIPCVIYGTGIGVIGIGPEGFVPLVWRAIGMCFLLGGLGIACPNKLLPSHRLLNWTCVMLSSLPLWVLAIGCWNDGVVRTDPAFWAVVAIFVIALLLTIADSLFGRPSLHKSHKRSGL